MNKIEYISIFVSGLTIFLAVLALIIFPLFKKASFNHSTNYALVRGYGSLFPCSLKVTNIVPAMNLIAFCKTAGWGDSIMFLKNVDPDSRVDRKQRKVKAMKIDQ